MVKAPFNERFLAPHDLAALPSTLASLKDAKYLEYNHLKLIELILEDSLVFSEEQAINLERFTPSQHKSSLWFQHRAGRIAGTKLYAVCHTDPCDPSLTLLKSICFPTSCRFNSKATLWGYQHTKQALDAYYALQKDKHNDFSIHPCGLILSFSFYFMGTTPDSFVSCSCCGEGVEIKCPLCKAHKTIEESCDDKNFCLDSSIILKRNHPYFYQVMAHINISGRKYCDFIVWTMKGFSVERIAMILFCGIQFLRRQGSFFSLPLFQKCWLAFFLDVIFTICSE